MNRSRDLMVSLAVVGGVAAAVLAACGEPAQEALPVEPELARVPVAASAMLVCPMATENTVRTQIGPQGGVVSVQGHSIYFPPGAVPKPVEVKLTVPASPHPEVDIKVNGHEHYRLARPVLATLSYERCDAGALRSNSIAAWHIDGNSRRPVERMASLDDRTNRTVTFVTNHFSGYVLIGN